MVLSNPCIEAWFVYHCANTCSSRTAGSALKELQNKWKQGTYAKGMVEGSGFFGPFVLRGLF